jgi:hypothetical protein
MRKRRGASALLGVVIVVVGGRALASILGLADWLGVLTAVVVVATFTTSIVVVGLSRDAGRGPSFRGDKANDDSDSYT